MTPYATRYEVRARETSGSAWIVLSKHTSRHRAQRELEYTALAGWQAVTLRRVFHVLPVLRMNIGTVLGSTADGAVPPQLSNALRASEMVPYVIKLPPDHCDRPMRECSAGEPDWHCDVCGAVVPWPKE